MKIKRQKEVKFKKSFFQISLTGVRKVMDLTDFPKLGVRKNFYSRNIS